MKKQKIFIIVAILLIILYAVSITPKKMQNDIFYTVSVGKQISENGIDMKDHFSWHELPYTYPHWLYDLGMYNIYNIGGWDGVYISTCIFSSILGLCIFMAISRLTKNKLVPFLVTIGALYLLKYYITARAQLVTFILFILEIYNIEKFLENKKIKNAITLVVIHILIANLHVAVWPFSFVLYLPYIAEYLIAFLIDSILYRGPERFYLRRKIKSEVKKGKNPLNYETRMQYIQAKNEKIKQKREKNVPNKVIITRNNNTKWLILIMLTSILTGFLTPLGKVPFTYSFLTFAGNTMKNINEHLPLTLIDNMPILCTLVIILAILIFSKVKIKLSDLFMMLGLSYLMFSSRRQQSMFVLLGSVAFCRMLVELLKSFYNLSAEELAKRFINYKMIAILSIFVVAISVSYHKKNAKKQEYIDDKIYPVEASEWILNNLDVKNIKLFNEYNYGSYLLYRGIPVFIDSRCDLYAPEYNTPTGKVFDGEDIFMYFINTSNISAYYGDTFKKFGVTHVILYKNSKINMLINKTDIEKYKELYSDKFFVIYEVLDY